MQRTTSLFPRLRVIEILAVGGVMALVAAGMALTILVPPSKTQTAGLIALLTIPALAYGAIRAPLSWPLAVYVALVPFDAILELGPATTMTRLLGLLSAGVILAAITARHMPAVPPRAVGLWAAALTWMIASTLWTQDPSTGIPPTLTQLLSLFALYLVVSLYPAREKDAQNLLAATLAGSACVTLYGLNILLHESQNVTARLWIRADANQIDPNHFAAALLLPLALAIIGSFTASTRAAKAGYVVLAFLFVTGIFVSESRGAIIAGGLLLVYLAWRARAFVQTTIFIALAGCLSLCFPSMWYRFVDPTQAGGAGRASIWGVGWEAIRQHWLVGTGMGTFSSTYDQVFLSVYQPVSAGWSRASHDLMIGTTVELGVVGFALVLAAWLAHLWALSAVRPSSPLYPARLALEGALLALLVEAAFLDTLGLKYLWVVFTLCCVLYQTTRTPRRVVVTILKNYPAVDPRGSPQA